MMDGSDGGLVRKITVDTKKLHLSPDMVSRILYFLTR